MDKKFEQKYHQLEGKHWWFKSRRDAILKFVKGHPVNSKILDVGCSSGHLLSNIVELGFPKTNLYGIDVSSEGVEIARTSGFSNCFVMDGMAPEMEHSSYDVIISSDSLEHMQYDAEALDAWFLLLKPGGTLIVFVPAFMALWSKHDIVNHHFRRYTQSQLIGAINAAGFVVSKSGYWNFFLFLPIAFVRMLQKLLPQSVSNLNHSDDLRLPPNWVNTLLKSLLTLENSLIAWFPLPFGVSTFCVAHKPIS
jgi:2-polyprenyl-3-methyl-5-hydroxy-6-metoxy-1,4-benzoquinol methylase